MATKKELVKPQTSYPMFWVKWGGAAMLASWAYIHLMYIVGLIGIVGFFYGSSKLSAQLRADNPDPEGEKESARRAATQNAGLAKVVKFLAIALIGGITLVFLLVLIAQSLQR